MTRYAVYWVPERIHPLWEAGCSWLGRDPEDPTRGPEPVPHTETPRRYGFHATLKAPTRLADGVDAHEFVAAVRSIAATTAPFAMPRLEVGRLADFIALRPTGTSEAVRALADRCVLELDRFRAPFTREEWQMRIVGLDADQQALTSRLGYHHVLDHWRFHMTLSNGFGGDPGARDQESLLAARAKAHFASALDVAIESGEIGIFVEPTPGASFVLRQRIAIGR
jgi:hypothetical protein